MVKLVLILEKQVLNGSQKAAFASYLQMSISLSSQDNPDPTPEKWPHLLSSGPARVPFLRDWLCCSHSRGKERFLPLKKMIGSHYFESVGGICMGMGKSALGKYQEEDILTPLQETYAAGSFVED